MLHSTPMQGAVVRRSLSFGLFTSVSRRISWPLSVRCCEGASQSINPSSINTRERDSPLSPSADLLPLPSRNEQFPGGGNDGASSYQRFKSVGSRSEPSRSSIPGKFSKYSRPISNLHTPRRDKKAFRKPMGDIASRPDTNVARAESPPASDTEVSPASDTEGSPASDSTSSGRSQSSVPSVDKIPDWMQQYQYSYSETPKAPILGFRQTPWSPFGPDELVSRPWTGKAPLKPSKKKLPVFDSFNPPPAGKKGVKYVQKPGPFLPGTGPKPAKTREEILGEPLTKLEIKELVEAVNKRTKQINLGRDGLTHNMLEVIHNHWKRSVCCKIKCKGVPTLDLDNVARTIEDKTGGVIIHRAGGVMYVFRGRNYNFKDRPQIQLMLWKPAAPIYPKLIQLVPEGLTEEEAKSLRGKGRRVAPLCKLSKNGVYMTLVEDVRAQFKVDEVVRVDCDGLNPSDYKKIGAKLRDLVPCILLSFEKEQIIMCRARPPKIEEPAEDDSDHEQNVVFVEDGQVADEVSKASTMAAMDEIDGSCEKKLDAVLASQVEEAGVIRNECEQNLIIDRFKDCTFIAGVDEVEESLQTTIDEGNSLHVEETVESSSGHEFSQTRIDEQRILQVEETAQTCNVQEQHSVLADTVPVTDVITGGSTGAGTDEVDELWQKAINEGKALQLDSQVTDSDVVFEKVGELSQALESSDDEDHSDSIEMERTIEQKISGQIPPTSPFDDVPAMGSLGVDELVKLLKL